jgi:hypothetical protein
MPQFQARLPHAPIPCGDGSPLLAFQKADRLKTAKGHRTSFDEAGAGQRTLPFNRKEVAAAEMLRARAPSPHAQLRHYDRGGAKAAELLVPPFRMRHSKAWVKVALVNRIEERWRRGKNESIWDTFLSRGHYPFRPLPLGGLSARPQLTYPMDSQFLLHRCGEGAFFAL